ncbi:methyltransferase-like protein 27 [Lampris incognitus]|uniref:methyltransferase-like protein 27 n=1 Tax=Lampris incognitus TaxID=2546036 RepID=UPI0024B54978|nr:methyltransferase-like protein 27 [Lampris incognitus]XP_056140169.1 methyltransferase-like protein 27 [Lampris incognitus]XP_056140170.1 methyltransferase-like protein 27 [Lampris incognitus]
MAASTRTFEDVKKSVLSCHSDSSAEEKATFYNSWARNYEQDVAVLEFRAPSQAGDMVSSHFPGDREAAVVLDVACGTGLVAKQMKKHGFARFFGTDGSTGMLELAKETGLYQDLSQCMLGKESLPVKWGQFDVVVICGALSVGQVPVRVVRELCRATKPGGYICMTVRSNQSNLEYKAALDSELRQMEEEGLWERVKVTEVENWERGVSAQEEGYISGCVYLYRSLPPV